MIDKVINSRLHINNKMGSVINGMGGDDVPEGGRVPPKQVLITIDMEKLPKTGLCLYGMGMPAPEPVRYDRNLETVLLFMRDEMNDLEKKTFLKGIDRGYADKNLTELMDMSLFHTMLLKNEQFGTEYQTYLADLESIKEDQFKRGIVIIVPQVARLTHYLPLRHEYRFLGF